MAVAVRPKRNHPRSRVGTPLDRQTSQTISRPTDLVPYPGGVPRLRANEENVVTDPDLAARHLAEVFRSFELSTCCARCP